MARGSIRRRGDAWELRVYVGRDPATGRDIRRSRTVRGSKRTADGVLRDMLDELEEGARSGPDASMATLLERWYAARSADWSPKNARETRRFIDRRLIPGIGALAVRDVTPERLDAFYARLRGDGLASSSVHRMHDVVHAALGQAVRWRWIARNPADDASPGRLHRPQVAPPSDEELDQVLEHVAARDPTFHLFLRLAAELGARRGELVALRWSDIDLDAGTIRVSRAVSDGVERARTKGGDRRPAVTLARDTVELVRSHRARCAEWALACGAALPTRAFVFSRGPDGARPWRADGVTQRFIRIRNRLGLQHVRLHDLRHYVATTLLAAGVDVGTVADRLGHTNPSTTLNVYRHAVPAADQAAARILGERRKRSS